MSDHYKTLGAVHILIIKNDKILLLRRVNTGWNDGQYNLPGGHLEEGETLIEAARREAEEEAGIEIKPMDLHLVHVQHRKSNNTYIDLYFRAYKWDGEPKLTEEDKSDDLLWADLNNLPENTVAPDKSGIEKTLNHEIYSQFGWKNE